MEALGYDIEITYVKREKYDKVGISYERKYVFDIGGITDG